MNFIMPIDDGPFMAATLTATGPVSIPGVVGTGFPAAQEESAPAHKSVIQIINSSFFMVYPFHSVCSAGYTAVNILI